MSAVPQHPVLAADRVDKPYLVFSNQAQKDWERLPEVEVTRFVVAVSKIISDLRDRPNGLPRGRGVKKCKGRNGVWEMAFSNASRATFEYWFEDHPPKLQLLLRRIGGHDIYRAP